MLKGATRILRIRKKGGQQQKWTPNGEAAGTSPSVGVSGFEALRMIYRPLPPDMTVEYEEDFGKTFFVQREFVSSRGRERLAFAMAPLAYSDVEMTKAKQQLAATMNRERQGSAVGKERVPFETSVDPETREVTSARYLFDDARMDYCTRFQKSLDDSLFSLMEACAVIFGCKDPATREAYFSQFLRLDKNSLEDDAERVRAMHLEQKEVKEMLKRKDAAAPREGEEDVLEDAEDDGSGEAATRLVDEFMEMAPLVKSYLAHAQGKAPIASTNVSGLGDQGVVAERTRWRRLMEKLIQEDYHQLSAVERADAKILNDQLHSVKFFDLRIGDTVREIVQLSRRATGTGGSTHASTLDKAENHPERRQSTDGTA